MHSPEMKRWKVQVLAGLAGAMALWAAGAALGEDRIIKPQSVTATAELVGGLGVAYAIDGSGLESNLVTGAMVPATYPAHTNYMWGYMYLGTGMPWMEFDLGSPRLISGFHLWNWNYTDVPGRCIKFGYVQVKQWGGTYTNVAFTPQPFVLGTGANDYRGSDYTFSSPVVGRFVKFTITNSYGDPNTGISEIRFVGSQDPAQYTIVKPVAAAASSQWNVRGPQETINGSCLTSDLLTGDPVPVAYPAHVVLGNNASNGTWLADGSALPATITFDLGAVYYLYGLHLWNYNGLDSTARSISNGVVSISTNGPIGGSDYTTVSLDANRFEQSTTTSYIGDDYVFSSKPVIARYVRIVANSNWGTGDNFIGISEIRFITMWHPPSGTVIKVR